MFHKTNLLSFVGLQFCYIKALFVPKNKQKQQFCHIFSFFLSFFKQQWVSAFHLFLSFSRANGRLWLRHFCTNVARKYKCVGCNFSYCIRANTAPLLIRTPPFCHFLYKKGHFWKPSGKICI